MNLVLICLEVSAAWVSQRLQIHKIVRTKLNGAVLANFPWESRGVLVGGENNCAREREGMWNSWTLALPDGVADDHVALEEEEEDCAEFRQNIVSIGPGQLGYSGDGKTVIFIEMMVILVITMIMMIMMTYWLQSPDRSTLPPKAPLPQHPPELQWIAMWLSGWRRWL